MKVQDKHTAFGRGEIQRRDLLCSSDGVVNCTSVAVAVCGDVSRGGIGIGVPIGICGVAGIGRLQKPSPKSSLSCWNREGDSLDAGCQ